MNIFWINTSVTTAQKTGWGFPFECECRTIEELIGRLNDGHVLMGNKLSVTKREDGSRHIDRREPIGIREALIASIQPYTSLKAR